MELIGGPLDLERSPEGASSTFVLRLAAVQQGLTDITRIPNSVVHR